jgi:hypothetical protein
MKKLLLALILAVALLVQGCSTTPQPSAPPRTVVAAYLREVTVQLYNPTGGMCAGVWVGKRSI